MPKNSGKTNTKVVSILRTLSDTITHTNKSFTKFLNCRRVQKLRLIFTEKKRDDTKFCVRKVTIFEKQRIFMDILTLRAAPTWAVPRLLIPTRVLKYNGF